MLDYRALCRCRVVALCSVYATALLRIDRFFPSFFILFLLIFFFSKQVAATFDRLVGTIS